MLKNEEIKKMLVKDLKAGIQKIEDLLTIDSEYRNSFYLLKSKFETLRKEKMINIISNEEFTLQSDKIRFVFFEFVDELKKNDIVSTDLTELKIEISKSKRIINESHTLISNLRNENVQLKEKLEDINIVKEQQQFLFKESKKLNKIILDKDSQIRSLLQYEKLHNDLSIKLKSEIANKNKLITKVEKLNTRIVKLELKLVNKEDIKNKNNSLIENYRQIINQFPESKAKIMSLQSSKSNDVLVLLNKKLNEIIPKMRELGTIINHFTNAVKNVTLNKKDTITRSQKTAISKVNLFIERAKIIDLDVKVYDEF